MSKVCHELATLQDRIFSKVVHGTKPVGPITKGCRWMHGFDHWLCYSGAKGAMPHLTVDYLINLLISVEVDMLYGSGTPS